MEKSKTLAIVFCLLALFIAEAPAVPIMFTRKASGSGTLDGQPFSADFILTSIGDTSDRQSSSVSTVYIEHISTSISIAGVGDFEFLTPTHTSRSRNQEMVGFSTGSGERGLLLHWTTTTSYASWDMLGPIGPLGGAGELLSWSRASVQTTGGILIFDTERTHTIFEAQIVPEPATICLLGLGAVMLRRKR